MDMCLILAIQTIDFRVNQKINDDLVNISQIFTLQKQNSFFQIRQTFQFYCEL